jgi:hypothetical protein
MGRGRERKNGDKVECGTRREERHKKIQPFKCTLQTDTIRGWAGWGEREYGTATREVEKERARPSIYNRTEKPQDFMWQITIFQMSRNVMFSRV